MIDKIFSSVITILAAAAITASVVTWGDVIALKEKDRVREFQWNDFKNDMNFLMCVHGEKSRCKKNQTLN